uniref:Uncharacterized protein n=1 Tax=Mycena chlorophos TaxID=658473 RepID=A0ABQ0LC29_MYCCL|nr:predicted protein [Mycena chlorophos]
MRHPARPSARKHCTTLCRRPHAEPTTDPARHHAPQAAQAPAPHTSSRTPRSSRAAPQAVPRLKPHRASSRTKPQATLTLTPPPHCASRRRTASCAVALHLKSPPPFKRPHRQPDIPSSSNSCGAPDAQSVHPLREAPRFARLRHLLSARHGAWFKELNCVPLDPHMLLLSDAMLSGGKGQRTRTVYLKTRYCLNT